jgi:hypothetical protein
LWQLSENLHRAELSVQERAEHIATWIRLTEAKAGQVVQLQIRSNGRPLDRGVAKAARELPIAGPSDDAKRKTVERALKIDAMTPEAKEAVAKAGLSNNQRVLLHIASAEPEMQVRAVAAFARHDARPVHPVHREVNRLWAAWNGASETARRMFLEKVEKAGQMAAVE